MGHVKRQDGRGNATGGERGGRGTRREGNATGGERVGRGTRREGNASGGNAAKEERGGSRRAHLPKLAGAGT
jgi:hypothetical protein